MKNKEIDLQIDAARGIVNLLGAEHITNEQIKGLHVIIGRLTSELVDVIASKTLIGLIRNSL